MGCILIAGWGRPAFGSHFLPVDTLSSCHSGASEPRLVRVPCPFHELSVFSPRPSFSFRSSEKVLHMAPSPAVSFPALPHPFPTSVWLIPWSANCHVCLSSAVPSPRANYPRTDLSSLLPCKTVSWCLAARQLAHLHNPVIEECGP